MRTLLAAADRARHRLEINFRLAGAGDAIEERDRIAALGERRFQLRGGGALVVGEIRLRKIRIGLLRDRLRRQHQSFQRTFVDQPVDHTGGDTGLARRLAFAAHHAVGEKRQHPLACCRHALRRGTGEAHADPLALGAEMLAHAQAHAQHHAARGDGVIRHPIDELTQFWLERRQVELFLDVSEPVVEPRIGLSDSSPTRRRWPRGRRAAPRRCRPGQAQAGRGPDRSRAYRARPEQGHRRHVWPYWKLCQFRPV